MRAALFITGLVLFIYLVYAFMTGILRYSMYGMIGTGIYDIVNAASPGTISEGALLTYVYLMVFFVVFVMMVAGLKGEKRK